MKTTVPTARLCDTEAEKNARLRRGCKLKPINKGTNYDITGKLRRLIHQIESGQHGKVTDVVLAIRKVKGSQTKIGSMWLGTSQPEVLHYMACQLEKEVL